MATVEESCVCGATFKFTTASIGPYSDYEARKAAASFRVEHGICREKQAAADASGEDAQATEGTGS